jgi:predicted nucleic acid-binding protein
MIICAWLAEWTRRYRNNPKSKQATMIILDTSVWIEFLKNNPDYFFAISSLLEQKEILAIELVFGELLQGVKSQRERTVIKGYYDYLPKIAFKEALIEAGDYSSSAKLLDKGVGLIDALIIVYAIKSAAQVWTLDKKLQSALPKGLSYRCSV